MMTWVVLRLMMNEGYSWILRGFNYEELSLRYDISVFSK